MGQMARPERASTWFLRLLAAACQAHGLEAGAALAEVGLSPALLAEREGRVPLPQARSAWDAAARLSGDIDFGLHAAERFPPGGFDVLDYLGRSVATFGEMLERVAQLGSIFTEDGQLTLDRTGKRAVLRHAAKAPLRHVSELMMAAIVLRGRELTGVDFAPASVSFRHPEPERTREHQRIFACPVRFGRPADELYLDASILKLPLKGFEPGLSEILDHYVRLVAGKAVAAPSLLSDVTEAITAALPNGEPRLEDVARALCITPRTLQRRLKEGETSFQALLDHVRHQLALEYLEAGDIPTTKLALLLGFSEPSAFYRAFRRWTGQSPAEARSPTRSRRSAP